MASKASKSDAVSLASYEEDAEQKPSRSRSGCLICRKTRVKCDEQHPTCGRCLERSELCEWPSSTGVGPRRQRNPRPVSSCEPCRQRKTKCDGRRGDICRPCQARNIPCEWLTKTRNSSLGRSASPSFASLLPEYPTSSTRSGMMNPDVFAMMPPAALDTGTLPVTRPSLLGNTNTKDSLRLYFATVHNFGFLSFIHEGDFWDRYEQGRVPETLCRLMAASALRFGGQPTTPEILAQADQWASDAGDRVLALVFREFGAVELMELVLCHHYDFLAGRYSRGWLMAGMAVRMMTFLRLHILDETPHPVFKPLLGGESLRRLAWSVWYLDATIDGGNFGFSAIREGGLTIQLPCDERPFLLHQNAITEPLTPLQPAPSPALGLGAHLIRSMQVRQILADAHTRISRRLVATHTIPEIVLQAEQRAQSLLDTLPREMAYNRVQYHAYKDQLPMLVHLHAMRNTCSRQIALLRILASPHMPAIDVQKQREILIHDAQKLSEMFSDAMSYQVALDPQLAMHAYNGIEVILFQPVRQSLERSEPTISRQDAAKSLKILLEFVRNLSRVSELVALVHPEAVNRMIRLGYVDDLTNDDIMAVLRKVHSIANVDSEFDFNESFWRYELSLARPTDPIIQSPNDRLLETNSDVSPQGLDFPQDTLDQDPVTRLQTFLATSSRRNSFTFPSVDQGDQSDLNSIPLDIQAMLGLGSASENTMFAPWLYGDNLGNV